MTTVRLARDAMATRFEIVLHGENGVRLRAAGEEALDEIERLEAQLSLFRSNSEIAHLNARAAREPVRVTPELFALLNQARTLSLETGGAFDITIAPLVRCWGFRDGSGRQPTTTEIAAAREKVGMHLVELDPGDRRVRFAREGVAIDLGAIGKGYAIERAAVLLREAGVESAILHGGTSTVYALGKPPEAESWTVAIEHPDRKTGARSDAPDLPLAVVSLRNEALSVSAVWGKFFRAEGKLLGHVLNPLTGEPVNHSLLAAVILPSATETDALSTALLALGPAGHDRISELRPAIRTLLVSGTPEHFTTASRGIPVRA